jgi:hypothetical protein
MTTCELLPRDLTPRKPALRRGVSRKPATRQLAPRKPATRQLAPRKPALGTPARRERARRLVTPGRVALAVGSFLVPWSVMLGMTLPAGTFVPNWSLAWMGLDLAEAAAALSTAILLRRGSPRAGLAAMAGAGLLFTDAWFDVCTSAAGTARLLAVGEAVLVELPLAAAALWLAVTLTRRPGLA